MSLLSRPLRLHDIEDTEQLVGHVIARSGLTLRPQQRDELATYLIEECWRLSLRYEQGRGSTTTFSGWATTNLRLRVVDWIRQEFGSSRVVHKRPQLVSLDADDPGGNRLDESLGSSAGDPAADHSADLERVLGEGGSPRARDYLALGLRPPGRVA
jgi:hypothetical protein